MKNKDIKFIIFSIIALTVALVFLRTNRSKKVSALKSPAVSTEKLKRSTASDPNSVTPSIKDQPKKTITAETISTATQKETKPTTQPLTLAEEIDALPTVKYKRFIPPDVATNFIGFAAETRKLTRTLSKRIPEQPPLDAQSVAKYTKAVERLYREDGFEAHLEDFPYLSNTETGELLKHYYRLETYWLDIQRKQVYELKFKIHQQLLGSSRDTFDEILRSADRTSEYQDIESVFMRLVFDLNINKSEKISYFNLIITRENQPVNAYHAQEFIKTLSQEED